MFPWFCNTPAPKIKDITILRRDTQHLMLPEEKAFLEPNEWEMNSTHGGYAPIIIRTPLSGPPQRPDCHTYPRIPQLRKELIHKTRNARLTTGPLLLGVQDLLIPLSADLRPRMGVAREILQFLPALKILADREFMELVPGDAVAITILSAGLRTRAYFPITRPDDQHMEMLVHYETAMRGIMMHAQLKEIKVLNTIRPPGCTFANDWKDVVDYYDGCQAACFLKFIASMGSQKNVEDWIQDLTAAHERKERVPILDAYDPEESMLAVGFPLKAIKESPEAVKRRPDQRPRPCKPY